MQLLFLLVDISQIKFHSIYTDIYIRRFKYRGEKMNFLQFNAIAKLIESLQENSILFIFILIFVIIIYRRIYTVLTSSISERIFFSTELNAVINIIKYTSIAAYTVILGISIVGNFSIVNNFLYTSFTLILTILFYLFFLFFYYNSNFRMIVTKFINKKNRFKWCVLIMIIINVWCIGYLMLICGSVISPVIKIDPLTNPIDFFQKVINEKETVIFLALFLLYCFFIYPLFLFYFKAITSEVRISLHLKSSIQIHNKYLLNPKVTNGFILIGDHPRKRACTKVTAVSLNEIERIDITTIFTHWNKKNSNIALNKSYSEHVKNIKSNKEQ